MSVKTITHVFSGVVGSGGTASVNKTIDADNIAILFVKVEPSIMGGTASFEIFQKDTLLVADISYKASAFTGDLFDPVEDLSGVETERTEGFVTAYQDDDASKELHIRVTNDDTSTKNFTITIRYLSAGDLTSTGTPVDNQLAIWKDVDTLEGDADIVWDATSLILGLTKTAAVNILTLDSAALTSAGQRDSHAFLFTGKAHDGTPHDADWRIYVDVITNGGLSQLIFESRIDGAGFGQRMRIEDTGRILVGDGSATTPSYSFANNGGHGLFFIDASGWGMSVATNEIARVTSTGLQLGSALKLKLPLENNAASPTLQFGDGDSGFYEDQDDRIKVSTVGINRFAIDASAVAANGFTNGWSLQWEEPSSTNPVFSFVGDPDTGLGRAGVDQLSLITAGVEAINISATQQVTLNDQILLTDINTETLAADKVIAAGDPMIHFLDPGGANRNVDLMPEVAGQVVIIVNTADMASEDLIVREDAGVTTIVTITQNEMAFLTCNGTVWKGMVGANT